MARRHEGIAGVVSFAGVADDQSGMREKLGDEAGKFRADGFHQDIGGDAASERLLLDVLHLGAGEKHGDCFTRVAVG